MSENSYIIIARRPTLVSENVTEEKKVRSHHVMFTHGNAFTVDMCFIVGPHSGADFTECILLGDRHIIRDGECKESREINSKLAEKAHLSRQRRANPNVLEHVSLDAQRSLMLTFIVVETGSSKACPPCLAESPFHTSRGRLSCRRSVR